MSKDEEFITELDSQINEQKEIVFRQYFYTSLFLPILTMLIVLITLDCIEELLMDGFEEFLLLAQGYIIIMAAFLIAPIFSAILGHVLGRTTMTWKYPGE